MSPGQFNDPCSRSQQELLYSNPSLFLPPSCQPMNHHHQSSGDVHVWSPLSLGSQPPPNFGQRAINPALLSAYMLHLWSGRPGSLEHPPGAPDYHTSGSPPMKYIASHQMPLLATSTAMSAPSGLPKSTLELLRQRAMYQGSSLAKDNGHNEHDQTAAK